MQERIRLLDRLGIRRGRRDGRGVKSQEQNSDGESGPSVRSERTFEQAPSRRGDALRASREIRGYSRERKGERCDHQRVGQFMLEPRDDQDVGERDQRGRD